MQRVSLLDSIFTRLVAWAIAVSIAVVLVLGWLVTTKFERMAEATVRWNVDADIRHMSDILEARGRRELIAHIEESADIDRPTGTGNHFLLLGSDGTRLAGDLAQWPDFDADTMGEGDIVLPGGRPALARAVEFPGGMRLLAARETGWTIIQLNQIGLSFVAGGLFVVMAVGVAGYLTASRLSRRVMRINDAFRDPEPRRLAALDTGRSRMDEIGELTRHSSAALARLDRLARAQRDTTDQIAHEMRTPLMHLDNRLVRAIQSQSQAREPDPQTTERLLAARGEIRHVVATLESLLDIAQSEAQRGNPQGLAEVDISALAANIADLYTASAEETGHDFRLEADEGVTMQGDEIQLSRVITNLLDNAFKYVPSGGQVRLIVTRGAGGGPLVAVADDGPGVPREYRETIFERFGRVAGGANGGDHNGGAGQAKGAGLGLALARAIAERHGMELRLAPTMRGARFELRPLPEA
ncbi:sensor histidine kinase [Croceicoccus marinus]|uniref:histidine kinase n=1 Tax=Croceicoccus marinus TaxID=450378 RepID=A0A1Z1FEA9_9SPHN|nr:HAMP domain-containing sensor histidine kinase [Croceicoccus marinus]ARU17076.1 ATP-binding protein [Croceicoccus marinus]